jgi:hypothetical protein
MIALTNLNSRTAARVMKGEAIAIPIRAVRTFTLFSSVDSQSHNVKRFARAKIAVISAGYIAGKVTTARATRTMAAVTCRAIESFIFSP